MVVAVAEQPPTMATARSKRLVVVEEVEQKSFAAQLFWQSQQGEEVVAQG